MEGDKQQMYPTFHSDKSKDSLFESLRVPNNYESTHHDNHEDQKGDDDDIEYNQDEALDALSPLSGIAAVGFLNRKHDKSVVSEEVCA